MQHGAVEEGLTRVIGVDGEPDRRLDGLDDDALLAIHRSVVMLRTYDERSVVYHRQGRIGTYAIYRGHEGIQAGAVHALDQADALGEVVAGDVAEGAQLAQALTGVRGVVSGGLAPAFVLPSGPRRRGSLRARSSRRRG